MQATIFNAAFLSIIFGALLYMVGSNYSDIWVPDNDVLPNLSSEE
jgi:hypothetical protein